MTDQTPTATDEVDLNPERCPHTWTPGADTPTDDFPHGHPEIEHELLYPDPDDEHHHWDSAEQRDWVDQTRRVLLEARDRQRAIDNQPCPVCGGDRLRPDFTGSGRCHA